MSYLTLEVEIDHGKVVAKEPAKLPEKARGLLTIIQPESHQPAMLSQYEAFEALQRQLQLDDQKVADWLTFAREARR